MNYIQSQIEWFKSFVSDTYEAGIAGKASSQRIIELAIIAVFLVAFMKVTLALVVTTVSAASPMAPLSLLDMPWGWATVIMGILGLKVYQKKKKDELDVEGAEPESEPRPQLPGQKS